MGASLRAELLKLRKRPATWVLVLTWSVLTIFFGYVLPYILYKTLPDDPEGQGFSLDELLVEMLPEDLVGNFVSGYPLFAGSLALVFGALAVGSEYGWGTVKTLLTQRPRRLSVYGGKIVAVALLLLAFVLPALVASAACSYLVASAENEAINWPSLAETARGVGAAWLIIAAWASLGTFLAMLFRGTALAIGLGLVWALVIENVISGFANLSSVLRTVQKTLLGANTGSLAATFNARTQDQGGAPGVVSAVSGTQATLVLLLYIAAFLLIAGLVFQRRDVA